MSRIINPEGAGKERTNLSKSVMVAIQEMMRQPEVNTKTRDLAAYVVLALQEIAETIEISVGAWEKRGYWLKADRFRMDWEWTNSLSLKLKTAIKMDRWDDAAAITVQIMGKLSGIKIPKRGYKTEFWHGSWDRLNQLSGPE